MIRQQISRYLKKARNKGMDVVVHDSTFSELKWTDEANWGDTSKPDPTHTGAVYQQELEDLRKIRELFNPDYLFIDCEVFGETVGDKETLKSWPEGWKKIQQSGLSVKEYFAKRGNRMSRDVEEALNDGHDRRIRFGFYGTGMWLSSDRARFPGKAMYDGVFNIYDVMNKNLHDFAMPSCYYAGDIEGELIDRLAAVRRAIDQPHRIIPWLAAGWHEPFAWERIRDQILEACSFGCMGIAYWGQFQWDAGAYLYQIRAINEVSPFEDIVLTGKFHEQSSKNNENAHIKGLTLKDEAIVLLSCYKRLGPIEEAITNPLDQSCRVYDASSRKRIGEVRKNGSIRVELDEDRDTRLLYFGDEWKRRVQ